MAEGSRGPFVRDLAALKGEIELALLTSDGQDAVRAVCRACALAMPGDGAAVTVMMSVAQRETVFAGDDVIAEFEQSQYTAGDGPSLLAFSTGRPVLISDIQDASAAVRWPGLLESVRHQPVRGVFSFPMRFGAINVGVCAIYRRFSGQLSAVEVAFVLDALDLTSVILLEIREGQHAESLLGRWLSVDGNERRKVHQATGMLIVQLGVSAETAFARLRGYAFAQETGIEQVAADIVARRLRLEADPTPEPQPRRG